MKMTPEKIADTFANVLGLVILRVACLCEFGGHLLLKKWGCALIALNRMNMVSAISTRHLASKNRTIRIIFSSFLHRH